jgi:hypothetical protein
MPTLEHMQRAIPRCQRPVLVAVAVRRTRNYGRAGGTLLIADDSVRAGLGARELPVPVEEVACGRPLRYHSSRNRWLCPCEEADL